MTATPGGVMSDWTFSICEAARRLQVDPEEVRRGLREGWFPGRFLSGGEVRIPAEEVRAAFEAWHRLAVLEPDIEESSVPGSDAGRVSRRDLLDLRDSVMRTLRSERQALVEEILVPLQAQTERIEGLEAQVRALRGDVEAMRRLEGPGQRRSSVDSLVREIVDLEELLGSLGDGERGPV